MAVFLGQTGRVLVNCDAIQLLLPEYLVPAIRDREVDWNAVGVHLEACPACAEECEQTRWLIGLIRNHADLFAEHDECAPSSRPETVACPSHMTIEAGWEDLKHRIPELAHLEKRQKRLTFFRRIRSVAAIAASLAVVVTLGWMVLSNSPVQPPVAVSGTVQPKAFAERVSSSGRQPLPFGQSVTTSEERQEVLLGGMHRVVINTDTSVTFEAATIGGQIRYDLQLARGELYVEVIPGHPVTVKTPNAHLIITGTKFDVRYDNHQTDLTLVKGSVRFNPLDSAERFVDVTTGHVSTVTGQSAPTPPREIDALAATAWARDLALSNAIAHAQPNGDLNRLDSIRDTWLQSKPLDLDSIDYVNWRDDHRDWFSRQFPWIFQLQKALEKEGVEVGYHELLIQSDDLWRFSYLQNQPSRFSILSFDSLLKSTSYYGFDKGWLPENVTAAKYALVNSTLPDETIDLLSAFKQWNNIFKTSQQSPTTVDYDILEHLFRASIYVANTRSLLWFAVKNGNYPLTDKEQSEVLALLQQQVNAVIICKENVLYQPSKRYNRKLWI
jgi:ferric-dicitrate binding protein FerR (iron transport regulator)